MADNNYPEGPNGQDNRGRRPGLPGGGSRIQGLITAALVVAILFYALRALITGAGFNTRPVDPLPTNDFVVAVKENRVKP